MECAQVVGSLPWLVNGTLDAAARHEIDVHLAGCAACARVLDETRFAARAFSTHIEAGALVDYAYGRPLDRLEASGVEAHLAACASCRDQLALIRESRDLMDEQPAAIQPSAAGRSRVDRWMPLALAAGLVLTTAVGGWFWVRQATGQYEARLLEGTRRGDQRIAELESALRSAEETNRALQQDAAAGRAERGAADDGRIQLEGQLAALRTPQPNAPILELQPEQLAERATTAPVEFRLPDTATTLSLILISRGRSSATRYGIDVSDATGRVVWRARDVPRPAAGEYTIAIPSGWLRAGQYTIAVFGDPSNPTATTETYRLTVR